MHEPEPFGYRDALKRRIRVANAIANLAGGATIVCVLLALNGVYRDLWLIGSTFALAAALTAVRVVTASRIALSQLGKPGPKVVPDKRRRRK